MYDGNNPTALTSQRLLSEAMNKLLAEKDYKDISVRELCERSGVSRQTFYSLFGSKENVILYELEHSSAILADAGHDDPSRAITLDEVCATYASYVARNYERLKMLVENDLTVVLRTQFYRAGITCQQSYVDITEEEREYAALYFSAGLCALTRRYVEMHEEPDEEKLAQLAYKMISGDVYRR